MDSASAERMPLGYISPCWPYHLLIDGWHEKGEKVCECGLLIASGRIYIGIPTPTEEPDTVFGFAEQPPTEEPA